VRTLVIANPASRAGATERRFLRAERTLRAALGAFDLAWTKAPRDAVRIAREAVSAGYERLLVGGGDGTASEVATGVLGAGAGADVTLGFLPFGTGGDLLRTLGIRRALGGALDVLRAGAQRRIDAGRLRYTNEFGERDEAYFLNEMSAGLAGAVAQRANGASKAFGAHGAFLYGTVTAIVRHRPLAARVLVDGELLHDGSLVLATASNGRYFGGGMQVAPRALLDDRAFESVIIPGLSRTELLARLPRLYRGTHLAVPGVLARRARRVDVTPLEGVLRFEMDGEPLGRAPLSAEIVPEALRVIAPGGRA
jgi:YegS/Rv2252/BmrU family lipid kinase